MAASVFDDRLREPTSAELDKALGETATLLESIEQHIVDQFGALGREWKFYSKKAGWTLALAHEGRGQTHSL